MMRTWRLDALALLAEAARRLPNALRVVCRRVQVGDVASVTLHGARV
jgi:hypothetical protein